MTGSRRAVNGRAIAPKSDPDRACVRELRTSTAAATTADDQTTLVTRTRSRRGGRLDRP